MKIAPFAFQQFFDNNGDPLASGKIYTYEAGTSTDKETYTDASGDAANTNPIILDANGRANIWLGDGAYKFVLKTSADVTIQTVEDLTGEVSSLFGDEYFPLSSNTVVNAGYQNSVIVAQEILTLSLIPAATAGKGFYFSVRNDSDGDVTIDPDGSELINGESTFVVGMTGSFLVYSDGVEWHTLFGSSIYAGADNTWTGTNTFNDINVDKVTYPDAGEVTIDSGGAIVITGSNHTVDTYLDAASDNLDTITTTGDGYNLSLRIANASRVVTVRHNIGNIYCPAGVDIVLDTTNKIIELLYDLELAKWVVLNITTDYVVNYVSNNALSSLQTLYTTTGGTAINFTGVPSTVKKMTIMLYNLSTNGSDNILLQLRDSGGVETSGYLGCTQADGTSGSNYTSGFQACVSVDAAHTFHATLTLTLIDSATNLWAFTTVCGKSNSTSAGAQYGAGSKALSAALDGFTITTSGGVNTFDSVNVNVLYEK